MKIHRIILTEKETKRDDNITNILTEIANNPDLSNKNKPALLELGRRVDPSHVKRQPN